MSEQAGPRRGADLLAIAFVLVAVGVATWALWGELPSIAAAVTRIAWWRVAAATALVVAGLLATAEVWRACLAGLGSSVSASGARRIFFPAQVGKYLPGAVWPFLAQMRLAREQGVPGGLALLAGATFMAVHIVTSVIVGALLLISEPTLLDRFAWVALGAPFALVLLHPKIVSAIARKVARADQAIAPMGWSAVLRPILWMVPAWVCYGAAAWLLANTFGGPSLQLAVVSTGGFALSWLVGVLIVIAPAGVGARETVIALALAPIIGVAAAASVGLVLRVCHTVADVGLAVRFGVTRK